MLPVGVVYAVHGVFAALSPTFRGYEAGLFHAY